MGRIELDGRRVLVMGLGLHGGGEAMVRFLCQRGAKVTVTDLRDAKTLAPTIARLDGMDVNYVLGEHRRADFTATDLVIRNPAVPIESPYLAAAKQAGVPIEMEMGIFFAEYPRGNIVGVTGTRGKTTTATFIHHALLASGRQAALAGNMRISAVAMLDGLDRSNTVVLELSSWQLEGLLNRQAAPGRAVVTNVLSDHLDRYRDLAAYAEAKATIVAYQGPDDLAVLNRENEWTCQFADRTAARLAWFSATDEVPGWSQARIKGQHNRANLAAATQVLYDLGLSDDQIAGAVASFAGVPHRQQQIAKIAGVKYVNDTTSTTPDAAIAALSALSPPFIWIAGGSEKHLDFGPLASLAAGMGDQIRAVVLLPGRATDRLTAMLAGMQCEKVESMSAAVRTAAELAHPGDTVLLSPACASFGLFLNEFDRGDQFDDQVQILSSMTGGQTYQP